jgi:LAO/AO transport system kinase
VESNHPDHRVAARALLTELAASAASRPKAVRMGISGVPGVGKSTFIACLGTQLTGAGGTVGVLTVDPSSVRTGGSVLGDKTRMGQLAADPSAYIRPSPAADTLGGVARATAQAIVVIEAAGFEMIIVETVGVGQAEIAVASMVDTFLYLTLARTGDQLQGIKKGILEIADVIAVNQGRRPGGRDQRRGEGARRRDPARPTWPAGMGSTGAHLFGADGRRGRRRLGRRAQASGSSRT